MHALRIVAEDSRQVLYGSPWCAGQLSPLHHSALKIPTAVMSKVSKPLFFLLVVSDGCICAETKNKVIRCAIGSFGMEVN